VGVLGISLRVRGICVVQRWLGGLECEEQDMKDTGGPAFPIVGHMYGEKLGGQLDQGMTLRDYFAAMAMQAYLRWPEAPIHSEALIADCVYTMADAMLAERSKT
jgi:hypothetical protein